MTLMLEIRYTTYLGIDCLLLNALADLVVSFSFVQLKIRDNTTVACDKML